MFVSPSIRSSSYYGLICFHALLIFDSFFPCLFPFYISLVFFLLRLDYVPTRHSKYIYYITSSESKVPLISAELGAGSLIAILALFIVALDVVALHGDEVGPIENYQQFFDIVQEKQYLANVFARYF